MATISPITESIAGTSVNGTAAGGSGDKFPNPKGNLRIHVTNASGSSVNVTLDAPAGKTRPAEGAFPAMALSDQVVAVPAGESKIIGPIPGAFNDTNGDVNVTYSSATDVTVWSLIV